MALQASSLGYNVLTRTIELRDLSLAATLGSPPFLLADRVVVLVDPGIYLGRLTISRISVARPRLTLIRNSDGTMNLPAARNDAPSSSPLQLGVVSLAGLSMSLEDRAAQRAFTLGPLDLRLDTGLGARGPGGDSAASPGAFGPANFTVKAGETDVSGTIARTAGVRRHARPDRRPGRPDEAGPRSGWRMGRRPRRTAGDLPERQRDDRSPRGCPSRAHGYARSHRPARRHGGGDGCVGRTGGEVRVHRPGRRLSAAPQRRARGSRILQRNPCPDRRPRPQLLRRRGSRRWIC